MKRLVYALMLVLNSSSPWASSQEYNSYMPPPRNMGPILDLRERDVDCGTMPLFGYLQERVSSALNAFAEEMSGMQLSWWPDLTDPEQTPDQVYNGINYDDDEEVNPSTRSPLNISLDSDCLEALNTNKFLDHLGKHPELKPLEILQLIDSEETCETALTYLNKEFDLKGMNFAGCNPLVLPGLIKYLKSNADSFKNLNILLCNGHHLNVLQVVDLLKIMGTRSVLGETKIDLTPGSNNNIILLVGLATRFANNYPNLMVIISDIVLPDGFDEYDFPHNLQLSIDKTIKSDRAEKLYKQMRRIIDEDAIEISYEEGKTLKLEN